VAPGPALFGGDYYDIHHRQKEEEAMDVQLLAGSSDLDVVYAPDTGTCLLVWSRSGGEKKTSRKAVTLLATAKMAC
jgi:hypothetical protein